MLLSSHNQKRSFLENDPFNLMSRIKHNISNVSKHRLCIKIIVFVVFFFICWVNPVNPSDRPPPMSQMPPKAKATGRARAPAKRKLAEEFPPGEVLTDTGKKSWKLGAPVGQGGFGLIYLGEKSFAVRDECLTLVTRLPAFPDVLRKLLSISFFILSGSEL